MTWKNQAVWAAVILLLVVMALGLWVRGPEATLDWILARFDALLGLVR